MLENIPTWLPELEKWEHSDYDGIKGSPPEWVPQPHKKKFHTARSVLFFTVEENKENYHEIKSRFDKLVADNKYQIVLALMKDKKDYDDSLFILVELFKAVSLGEGKGLRLLAGEDAVSGFLSRQGHKQREKYQAKLDYQKKAKPFFEANKFNITATIKESALSQFRKQHYGAHTLRDWLKEIRPAGTMQKGRPKKT